MLRVASLHKEGKECVQPITAANGGKKGETF